MGTAVEGKQEPEMNNAAKPESTANGQGQGQNSEDMGTAVEGKQEPMTEGAAKPEDKAKPESTANGQGQGQNSEDMGTAVEGKQEPEMNNAAKPESTANGQGMGQDQGLSMGQNSEEKGAAVEDNKHAQDMLEEEHQALNRQKQLEDQANATEMELLKDALIDSIISKPHNNYEEEELIF